MYKLYLQGIRIMKNIKLKKGKKNKIISSDELNAVIRARKECPLSGTERLRNSYMISKKRLSRLLTPS
jgi:hypothetical protein